MSILSFTRSPSTPLLRRGPCCEVHGKLVQSKTVDDGFQILDVAAAQEFLRRFPVAVRQRGHNRYHEGAVENLKVITPGVAYSALVRDSAWTNEVSLSQEPDAGWSGACSCPGGSYCVHVFAAMTALLAEHRTAAVRQLSTGQASSPAALASLRAKPETAEAPDFRDQARAAAGRPLTRSETRFLVQLHELYLRCTQTHQLSYWDLQGLGFPTSSYTWAPLKIWPAFPSSEHEFWLYIANFLNEQKIGIPEFLVPLSDLSLVRERLVRWRRASEIERWKKTLGSLQVHQHRGTTVGEVDLRLAIQDKEARLQWQRPGHNTFEPLKQGQFRQLMADYDNGYLKLTPEAEMLWQFFAFETNYSTKIDLDILDPEETNVIGRILRVRSLESRVVNETGQPLPRFADPLRWELSPAQTETDDYRFRLVQSNGQPPPEIISVFPGNPALYLTPKGILPGPAVLDEILDPTAENPVPAPAIESAAGIEFLNSLGIALPPKLRERVQVLPWTVTITCALRPTYPGSDTDECSLSVLAEAPDGRRQAWTGFGWAEKKRLGGKQPRFASKITVYDGAALAGIPPLLEPLKLKPTQLGGDLVMRLSKKFADTFGSWLKSVPPHITVNLEGELASFLNGDVVGRVKLEVTEQEIDWFDLKVVLDVADTTLTKDEIRLLLNAKGSYVRLKGKGWRRLQYDLGEEDDDRLARLGLSPRELSAEPQRLHALQLADESAKKFLPAQQAEQIQRRASEIKARVAPELPRNITAQLRPYQLEGFHFLAYLATNRFGGILADDMGLGKTLQTLAWLVWLREQDDTHPNGQPAQAPVKKPSLVVCPKSVMDNWQAEAERFAPGLRVKIWPASELSSLRENLGSADLHVLNYNQLRLIGEHLGSVQWLALVLDEGQYIKNPNSQTAQIARSLRAQHRLVLSGTPIENRLLDLWSLMAFTMPGILGNRAQFARLYDLKSDPLALRRLAARVRPFLLRRTKSQVAQDLPDRIEEDLFCEIEAEQQALYRAELKAAQQLLLRIQTQKELAAQQFHFLTSLLRLRQICCDPRLVKPDCATASAKTDSLLELLEPLMEEGQKVLVFSQFVQMLELLRPELEKRGWPIFYLAGQTENRGELVRQFQDAAGPGVFLISLKAGGFGLNLTAASYVVLFDPWWNPAVENQAIDRTHRIGQTSKVIAYRLLIKNSIEEKIRALQKHKKALAQDVFGEEKFAQSLTLEDLRFLFSD